MIWGEARSAIIQAVEFLCRGKMGVERAAEVDEAVALVKSIGWSKPGLQTNELGNKEAYQRESWARRTADHVVNAALSMTEDRPLVDRNAVLREIAKWALWHMSNACEEARSLKSWIEIDRLKQPDWRDPAPGRD